MISAPPLKFPEPWNWLLGHLDQSHTLQVSGPAPLHERRGLHVLCLLCTEQASPCKDRWQSCSLPSTGLLFPDPSGFVWVRSLMGSWHCGHSKFLLLLLLWPWHFGWILLTSPAPDATAPARFGLCSCAAATPSPCPASPNAPWQVTSHLIAPNWSAHTSEGGLCAGYIYVAISQQD